MILKFFIDLILFVIPTRKRFSEIRTNTKRPARLTAGQPPCREVRGRKRLVFLISCAAEASRAMSNVTEPVSLQSLGTVNLVEEPYLFLTWQRRLGEDERKFTGWTG
jgi:hypothetical protein